MFFLLPHTIYVDNDGAMWADFLYVVSSLCAHYFYNKLSWYTMNIMSNDMLKFDNKCVRPFCKGGKSLI